MLKIDPVELSSQEHS